MIHRNAPSALALAASLLALSACGENNTQTAEANAAAAANATNTAAAPVELPPAIRESKTYRCKDNSLVYVNFLDDGVSANVRDKEEEPPAVQLKAAAEGQAFEGTDGQGGKFSLSGSGTTVTYTSPDSGTQSCRSGAA